MDIQICHLIEGAKQADGLAVIIDVFRAFSLEPYLFASGAGVIRPVGSIRETFAWREKDPGCFLIGERHGKMIEGCDMGNSPSCIDPDAIRGRQIIHTTSAGTQGIANAVRAQEVLTGSFVNARAVAEYIRRTAPKKVSLVAMGKEGLAQAEEDELCALYLKSLLEGDAMPDIDDRLQALRIGGGRHFFDPARQDIYPEEDFRLCIRRDIFDFVIRVEKDRYGFIARKYSPDVRPGE